MATVLPTRIGHGARILAARGPNANTQRSRRRHRASLEQQIGGGRGPDTVPGTSLYFIARDPARAIRRGRQLFQRKFTVAQGVGPRKGTASATFTLTTASARGLRLVRGLSRETAGRGGLRWRRGDASRQRDSPHLFGSDPRRCSRTRSRQSFARGRDAAVAAALSQGDGGAHAVARQRDPLRGHRSAPGRDGRDRRCSWGESGSAGAPVLRRRDDDVDPGVIVGAMKAEMGLESADPDLCAAPMRTLRCAWSRRRGWCSTRRSTRWSVRRCARPPRTATGTASSTSSTPRLSTSWSSIS